VAAQDDPHQPTVEYVYGVYVVRAYTKEGLVKQIEKAVQGREPEDIISINYHADLLIFPLWRRNFAVITLRI
jgi:hypothetical protein